MIVDSRGLTRAGCATRPGRVAELRFPSYPCPTVGFTGQRVGGRQEGVVSEWASVLDGLAGVDVAGLSADERSAFVATLVAGVNRLPATLHGAVRAAGRSQAHQLDGAGSMRAWLRGSCRLSPAEAAAIVSTGRRLESLPVTAPAFAAGDISTRG
jgi:hypothetical protein